MIFPRFGGERSLRPDYFAHRQPETLGWRGDHANYLSSHMILVFLKHSASEWNERFWSADINQTPNPSILPAELIIMDMLKIKCVYCISSRDSPLKDLCQRIPVGRDATSDFGSPPNRSCAAKFYIRLSSHSYLASEIDRVGGCNKLQHGWSAKLLGGRN